MILKLSDTNNFELFNFLQYIVFVLLKVNITQVKQISKEDSEWV